MFSRLASTIEWIFGALVLIFILVSSTPLAVETHERVRAYTRGIEFDYFVWTVDAAWGKIQQAALNTPRYMPHERQKQVVYEYLRLTKRLMQTKAQIAVIFTNPEISDPASSAAALQEDLTKLSRRQKSLQPFAEAVLQAQISHALDELGLTAGGQPVPPVLYHVSPLPLALIVSPRDKIQTDANISLQPDLDVSQQTMLEDYVDKALNVSSLVVPVGGIGSYPTMVMETTDLPWQIEVIAHEWIHNYLSLRPLGMNYDTSPELRTMNETAASLAGKEIGYWVLRRYYAEQIAGEVSTLEKASMRGVGMDPKGVFNQSPFDFRAEMHLTRVRVDELLAQGKIEEAEAYMEQRRRLFWENGYPIRKLNQAYFAFYGAYADVPGGPAGEDPVGPAVRELRERSGSLKEFLEKIGSMNSFEDLKAALGQ